MLTGKVISWLLAASACSAQTPNQASPAERPFPFSELRGVSLDISVDSLRKVRRTITGDSETGFVDSVPPFEITFFFGGSLGTSLSYEPTVPDVIWARRLVELGDTAGPEIDMLVGWTNRGTVRCRQITNSIRTLTWHSHQIGDNEFIAAVVPPEIVAGGANAIPAYTTIGWRRWVAERENEVIVPCPGKPATDGLPD